MKNTRLAITPLITQIFDSNETAKKIRSEVIFGTPSKSCTGNGVCMLMTYGQHFLAPFECPRTPSWVTIDYQQQILILSFDKKEVDVALINNRLNEGKFEVEEAFTVPLLICRSFGGDGMQCVPPGCYPVLETANRTDIFFKLEKRQAVAKRRQI